MISLVVNNKELPNTLQANLEALNLGELNQLVADLNRLLDSSNERDLDKLFNRFLAKISPNSEFKLAVTYKLDNNVIVATFEFLPVHRNAA